MTRIRYKPDNQIHTIIWRVVPGRLQVAMYISISDIHTKVNPEDIAEFLA